MQTEHIETPTRKPTSRPSSVGITAATVSSTCASSTVAATAAVAIFAHDMRGPLANLSILLEAIGKAADGGHTDRVRRDAARAERVIERLEGMLSGMLGRFRSCGDPLAPANDAIDLSDLVEAVVMLNRPLAEQRGVKLHCYVVEPLTITGDAHLLMQAIDNLLNNAITFTPAGGRVVCEAGPAASGDILVQVTDGGPGLSSADLARLFQPFSRTSAQAQAPRTSHGLGLWIVSLIAERHGGRAEAASEGPGQGAVFSLRLPSRRV